MTESIQSRVRRIVDASPVLDLHTHLFAPAFDGDGPQRFLLWGIDSLLTYHYLQAEFFRVRTDVAPEAFLASPKADQADAIWRALFIERTPLSEACRGVVTTLARLGLDPGDASLDGYRGWFASQSPSAMVDRVMELSRVSHIVMTNEVFDEAEHAMWMERPESLRDPRFSAVLRIDTLLDDRSAALATLSRWGYDVSADLNNTGIAEIRRFLREWIVRTGAVYVAASLPPEFSFPSPGRPDAQWRDRVIADALMPEAAEHGIAWAMMVGSRRGVNPRLASAGDSLGPADVHSIERLCDRFPRNRFLATVLSRESQHALAVAARKFANLMPFGCWWFVNTPSLITEITRMRLELLGSSFIPQHSDARVLEQLIYKWNHSRVCVADALAAQYAGLPDLEISDAMIEADAARLLRGNAAQSITPGE